jgi:hypothetical protein
MKRRTKIILALIVIGIVAYVGYEWLGTRAPLPEDGVELTVTHQGRQYKIAHGQVYQVNSWTGRWRPVQKLYDPDYLAKNYTERDGVTYRQGPDGNRIEVKRSFNEDFENAGSLRELINLDRGWTSCELLSPRAPTPGEYVPLRNRILKGEGDFVDNRVEPSGESVHQGRFALKCIAVPASGGMVTSKASLSTELLHFVKGDDVWISFWCRVSEGSGMPFTVMDLETTWLHGQPGMRIVIEDGKHACFQLSKWFGNPYYRQPKDSKVVFPRDRWVHLKAHLTLTEKDDGIIQLWQDDQLILDTTGQTLVLPHVIYNSLEIGISAYDEKTGPATFFVDDLSISTQPPNPTRR